MDEGFATLNDAIRYTFRYPGDRYTDGVHANGERDEAFGRDLAWRPTFLLYSAERGNLDNDVPAISAQEADGIVARVRGTAHGPV